ncbi:hypothetical protein [Paenibacillus sp. S-12]|uniref:hypothetical protein n=1 Tax=Paenibacillus sp. S-12 TaxID=3031371 RepID=UPI0025A0F0B1|nr:hypothetical protein [Paenibacillus sp. S-12]
MKVRRSSLLFLTILVIITSFTLTSCEVYKGSGEYWNVKVVQNSVPDHFEIGFEYIGQESLLESLEFKFLNSDFNASGSTQINKKPPYIYSVKYVKEQDAGEKLQSDSLKAKIKWNNKEEEVTLSKR